MPAKILIQHALNFLQVPRAVFCDQHIVTYTTVLIHDPLTVHCTDFSHTC